MEGRLKSHREGDAVVAKLAGDLDMAATFVLEPEFERLTHDSDALTLVVDLSDVEFIDSSGVGLLLATQQRLESEGIRFVAANPPRNVRRTLDLTGTTDTLGITAWPPAADR